MHETAARQELIEVCLASLAARVNQGSSGNASRRWADGFLVTPSAMAYEDMVPDDIVFVGPAGAAGRRRPSSEWHVHRAIYASRPEVHAVVHLHSPAAVALSTLRWGIPAFHYMVALAGGPVRCSDYAPFGTEELAALAVEALRDRSACLLGNHGQIALGATPRAALDLAVEVEALADQYLRAKAVGEPVLLNEDQMADAIRRFAAYRSVE